MSYDSKRTASDTPSSSSAKDAIEPAINCLPVEILSSIFCHLSSPTDPDDEDTHAPAHPWRPVLHVCKRWRQVAFDTKELWQVIPLGHPEWTKMALRLSRPRTIAIDHPSTRSTDLPSTRTIGSEMTSHIYNIAESVLLPEYHRAHRIHILLYLHDDRLQIQNCHILDYLKEVTPDELVDFCLRGDRTIIPLHHTIFKKEPACLRHLRLELCMLYESPNTFVNTLTTLRLDSCILTASYDIYMLISDIKLFLSLEVLHLMCTIPFEQQATPPFVESDHSRTLFPNLMRCRLFGHCSIIYVYLANIGAPLACHWNIIAKAYAGHVIELPTLEPILPLAQFLASRIALAARTLGMELHVVFSPNLIGRGSMKLALQSLSLPHVKNPWCTLDWGDPEFVGGHQVPTLSAVVAAIPSDGFIASMCLDMELDDTDWEAIRPLLSRTQTLQFESPRYAINCPFIHRHPSDEEMRRLGTIQVNYVEGTASAPDESDFHLIDSIIRNCISRDELRVRIQVGTGWPTEEELAFLKSYGEFVELQRVS
ncbi:hypothetical protein PENSPDRAFT_648031, partial [Peniophora sp. CONT]